MIIDIVSEFSDNQDGGSFAVGANISTLTSLDTGVANSNIGMGSQLFFRASVGSEAVVGTTSTVQAILEHSADNSTFITLVAGLAIAEATLVAGAIMFEGPIPIANRRYLRVNYAVLVNDLSAGFFNAHIGIE